MNHIISPDTSDAGIEREIQARGLTAARVTLQDVEAAIAVEIYFTAEQAASHPDAFAIGYAPGTLAPIAPMPAVESPLRLLTFCVLTLRNGFTVTGESACASPENFNAEVGRKIARENARNKVWQLLGYELRTKLAAQAIGS